MSNLSERIINKDSHHLAQSHGLKISAIPDHKDSYAFEDYLGTIVTAGWVDSDFGDPLIDTPANEGSVDDWLNLYCENTLECTPNDIIWLPFSMTTNEDGTVKCEINDINHGWPLGANGGIIFIKKEKAKQYFSAKNLTNDMVREIEDVFNKQIREIDALKKGSVYRIDVNVAQKQLSGLVQKIENSCGGIFEMYEIDSYEAADEILANSIRGVEYSVNAISITFKMDKELDEYGYLPRHITSQLNEHLSFMPAVSHANLHADNMFTISLSLSTVPPFLSLCADTHEDLLAKLCKNINKLNESPTLKPISLSKACSIISKNEGYTGWTPIMASALVMSLTDSIKDISFVKARLLSDKNTPEIQVAQFLQKNSHSNTINNLVSAILKKTGGAEAFLERKMQFDESNRAEGLVGLVTLKQRLDFFNDNKEIIITYGRGVASSQGFSSFIEVVEDGLSKYGYDADDISDALNASEKLNSDASIKSDFVRKWVTSWTVNQIHKDIVSFIKD